MQYVFLGRSVGVLLLLTFISTSASAQKNRLWSRPNVLKTNLVAPVSLFYERALTQRFALQTSVRWFSYTSRHKQEFVNAAVEGRFFMDNPERLKTRSHPTGFYVGPYLKARSLHYINEIGYGFNKVGDLDEVIIKSIGFGIVTGYQLVTRKGVCIDGFIGGGAMPPALSNYNHTLRYSTVTSDRGYDYYSMDLRVGISLGYAF